MPGDSNSGHPAQCVDRNRTIDCLINPVAQLAFGITAPNQDTTVVKKVFKLILLSFAKPIAILKYNKIYKNTTTLEG
jgi:hypothetical protein